MHKIYIKFSKIHPKKGQKSPSTAHSIGKNDIFSTFRKVLKPIKVEKYSKIH